MSDRVSTDTRALRHVFGRDHRHPKNADFARNHFSNSFRDLPKPTGPYPFRLDLRSVLGAEETNRIAQDGKLVFHSVGDTGHAKYGAEAQDAVASAMIRQRQDATSDADRPAFFYHLGDVVYYNGAQDQYETQFYEPYDPYTAPIFAIPGNHDGAVPKSDSPLQGFMETFCAAQPKHSWMAGQSSNRTTMIQPNCYWTLKTPLVTIIGLYSNVPGRLDHDDDRQLEWFRKELLAAKDDNCIIIAVHHPPYSFDSVHGGHTAIRHVIDDAMHYTLQHGGRLPDLVLTAHVHNYQHFTRDMSDFGSTKPLHYLVAGGGGFAGYAKLHHVRPVEDVDPITGVSLLYANDKLPSFLRVTVTRDALVSESFTVGHPPNTDNISLIDAVSIKLR